MRGRVSVGFHAPPFPSRSFAEASGRANCYRDIFGVQSEKLLLRFKTRMDSVAGKLGDHLGYGGFDQSAHPRLGFDPVIPLRGSKSDTCISRGERAEPSAKRSGGGHILRL